MKWVLSRVEMTAEMRDDGEEDDLDLECLANKNTIVEARPPSPDESIELEEMKQMVRRLLEYLERTKNPKTKLICRRYFEDTSYKQLAEEERTTCSAMRIRVNRAVRSLTRDAVLKPLDALEIRPNHR